MEHNDYYSIMEKRIKHLSGKYDPLNKFPLEWKKKMEEPRFPEVEKAVKRSIVKQLSAALNSVIASLF